MPILPENQKKKKTKLNTKKEETKPIYSRMIVGSSKISGPSESSQKSSHLQNPTPRLLPVMNDTPVKKTTHRSSNKNNNSYDQVNLKSGILSVDTIDMVAEEKYETEQIQNEI